MKQNQSLNMKRIQTTGIGQCQIDNIKQQLYDGSDQESWFVALRKVLQQPVSYNKLKLWSQ